MKHKVKFFVPRIDLARYEKALEKEARIQLGRAIQEYIQIVTSIIPVWSGASIATFTELAALASVPLTIGPQKPGGGYSSRRQELGRTASDSQLIIDQGRYGFTYETELPHLIFNEHFNANLGGDPAVFSQLIHPGPYRFQDATDKAVQHVLGQFNPPDPLLYQRVVRVK